MSLVVEEEKEAIVNKWTANVTAKNVANQLLGAIRLPVPDLGLLQEPVIGLANGIAVEFVEIAMEVVGAALGDHGDLRPRRAALGGAVIGSRDTEFLGGE